MFMYSGKRQLNLYFLEDNGNTDKNIIIVMPNIMMTTNPILTRTIK